MLKSVALINFGLSHNNLNLQPWRYLYEVAIQLRQSGHRVTLIGDEEPATSRLDNLHIRYLSSASNLKWKMNQKLVETVSQTNPDVIAWHVGLNSFIHQNFDLGLGKPTIGIFTSPLYRMKDLKRLSPVKLIVGYRLSGMACIGSLLPMPLLRAWMRDASLDALIVQTETTRRDLVERRLWTKSIYVIPPGVDEVWLNGHSQLCQEIRRRCGYSKEDMVVVYFGSQDPLRGLSTLLKAFEIARNSNENLKLLILSRQPGKAPNSGLWGCPGGHDPLRAFGIQFVEGPLPKDRLASYVAAGDAVALPFELVPSDAPFSLLEARALGKPLITTRVACLPELAGGDAILTQPGDKAELALALLKVTREEENPDKPTAPQGCHPTITGWKKVGEAWSKLIQNL